MNHFTGRTSTIGEREPDNGQFDTPGPTHGAHGCAMLVKREVIERVGMFPQKFFLYYEEWDWCARIQKAGFSIWYTPDAVIYHKESMSVGKNNPMKIYYHTRNRILYMRRNTNFFQLMTFSAFFIFFTFPKSVLQFHIQKTISPITIFYKGRSLESIFFQLFACEVNKCNISMLQIFRYCFFPGLFLYLALGVAYLFVLSLAGLLRRKKYLFPAAEKKSIAVIIPSYKEDNIILILQTRCET